MPENKLPFDTSKPETLSSESLNLPAKLTLLIKEIESKAKCSISFRETKEQSMEGGARLENGVPCIYLKVPAGLRDICICHELLHLQCELAGFPRTKTLDEKPPYDYATINNSLSEIGSIIEHQIIYPKMLQLGYDPYTDVDQKVLLKFLPELENEDYPFGDMHPTMRHLFLTLHLSRALLETNFSALRKRVRKVSKIKCPQSLVEAKSIVCLIREVSVDNPQTCKRVLADSIQILKIPKETYEIHP